MSFEPLSGWREVVVTESRRKQEFALAMRRLAQEHYPHVEKIRVVLDNLSTGRLKTLPPGFAADLPGLAEPDTAMGSAAKNTPEFIGNVTSEFLPRSCFFAISSALSTLSACTATLKRAAPLVAWTAILTITPHPSARRPQHRSTLTPSSHSAY
jgi:hypothetical protein